MIVPINHRNITKFSSSPLSGIQTYNTPFEIKKESFIEKKIKESEESKAQSNKEALKFGGISFLVLSILGLITQVQGFFIAGFVFLGVSLFIMLINGKSDDTITFKYGLIGEQSLRNKLREILSNEYKVIYNLNTPYGDIDALVVGPAGVFVLEVKNHNGYITVDENGWTRQKVGRGGTVYDASIGNPEKQAKKNVWYISNLLKQNGINVWVDYYVVLTNPDVKLNVKNGNKRIIHIGEIDKIFKVSGKLTSQTVDSVLKILNSNH